MSSTSQFFRLSYVLFCQLTVGVAFYSTLNGRLQVPSWKCKSARHDHSLTMRTLLIDNFDSYTYNIWQLLSEVNGEEPIVVYNNAFNYDWDELMLQLPKFDNIVISPGPGSPDILADFGICKDAILRSNLPVLGVCLGHQGIAHSFGGIVQRAAVPMHGRLSSVSHTNTGLFEHIPQDTEVVRYHSLIVDNNSLPSELKATAWTNDNIMMGLQHVSKPIYGVQFHPESISTACGKQLFLNFKNLSKKYHEDQKLLTSNNEEKMRIEKNEVTKSADTENVAESNRNIFIVKKTYEKTINIKMIFDKLYGNSTASFWLDSSSFGPVQGRVDNSTPLSFFGDLDSSVDSYAIEYYGSNKLIKRKSNKNIIENINQNIFEYLDEILEKNKNISDIIHYTEIETTDFQSHSTIYEFEVTKAGDSRSENSKNSKKEKEINLPFNVTSAYFGFLGYEARHEATEILTLPYLNTYEKYNLSATHREGFESSKWKNQLNHPMAFFMHPEQYIVYNHKENSIYIVSEVRHRDEIHANNQQDNQSKNSDEKNHMGNGNVKINVEKSKIKAMKLLKKIDDIYFSGRPVSHGNKINEIHGEPISFLTPTLSSTLSSTSASATFSSITESTENVNKNDILYSVKSKEQYRNDIKQCLEYIKAGESYEICLTLQFKGEMGEKNNEKILPLSVYENLRNKNPAPYSCFLHYDPLLFMNLSGSEIDIDPNDDPSMVWYKPGGFTICSSSPERYLKATKVRLN